MISIENSYLKVAISPKGAQLTSLYNKGAQIEHLWQANENVWPWHAPNLFPIVGGLVDNQLHVNGKAYTMNRHGFARQSEFEVIEAGANHAVLQLTADEQTTGVYPYQFAYQVLYDLIDNVLRVTYKVINLDDQPIYFSVGAHPAFNVPFNGEGNYEDYYLEFEEEEKLETNQLSAEGYLTNETHPVELQGRNLPLTRHLFDADALVFKNIRSKAVTIKSNLHQHTLKVRYLGIWAKPGADFVCIEPWLGYADATVAATDISLKPAIQKLDKGHVFEAPFYISI
jgi:galactose mutarotase-like enzyme